MEYKDYYNVLGVSKDADDKEIKRAFRKLAQKYHPDKNPGDDSAEARFKDINEAYAVLSDPDKRSKYDRFGSQWEQYERAGGNPDDFDWSQWGGGGGRGYSRTVTPEEFEQMFGGMGGMGSGMGGSGGFSSFFDALFGGGFGGRSGGTQYRQTRTDPGYGGFGYGPEPSPQPSRTEVPVDVTLDEAFRGTQRMLQTESGKRLEVNIPPGVRTGSKVRMRGSGDQGDIYLKINVLPDGRFTREGDNLRVTVPVDLYTAVLGGEVQVPTLDGAVVLTVPSGSQNGKTFRLRGQGMPELQKPEKRGDLLAKIDVTLPQDLSADEIRLFEDLRSLQAQTS
jgi:curved DNA-binding protein